MDPKKLAMFDPAYFNIHDINEDGTLGKKHFDPDTIQNFMDSTMTPAVKAALDKYGVQAEFDCIGYEDEDGILYATYNVPEAGLSDEEIMEIEDLAEVLELFWDSAIPGVRFQVYFWII